MSIIKSLKMRFLLLILCVSAVCLSANVIYAQTKLTQKQKWEQKISNYARLDAMKPPPDSVVLFIGSSTIENWKTLGRDFPGTPVLNRGISGTKTVDLIHYVGHVVQPYNPRKIFVYEGDNDIGYKWSPDSILGAIKQLYDTLRQLKPQATIYFISIKPAPVRLKHRARIEATNKLIEDFARQQPGAAFVDVYTPMLSKKGGIDPDNYRADGLHLTAKGYAIWEKVISPLLQ